MTHPPEPPRLRTYVATFDTFVLEFKGHYNDDQGHYDTHLADINEGPYGAIKALLDAVQPDYDALIKDCLLNGTAVEI